MISKAIKFAEDSHINQTRKGTNIPYILHPLEAGIVVERLTTIDGEPDEELVVAAILHDVYEDTGATYELVEKEFGRSVADLIHIQSEDKTKTWKQRKQHTIETLRNNKNVELEILTLADKLSNLRSTYKDYRKLGDSVWDKFNMKDIAEQKWYYTAIAKEITQLKHTDEYNEYLELLDLIFN